MDPTNVVALLNELEADDLVERAARLRTVAASVSLTPAGGTPSRRSSVFSPGSNTGP